MNSHFTPSRLGAAGALLAAVLALFFLLRGGDQPGENSGHLVLLSSGGSDRSANASFSPNGFLPTDTGQAIPVDPLLVPVLSKASSDTKMMHDLMATRESNAKAVQAEKTMGAIFKGASIAAQAQPIRIRCIDIICEIAGTVAADRALVEAELGAKQSVDALFKAGYSPGPSAFASSGGKTTFVFYVNREIF